MTAKELADFSTEFTKTVEELINRKNADYSSQSVDPFSNFKSIEVLGIKPEHGFLTRMMDKLRRVASFVENGELKVKEESVQDTLLDLAGYCCLFSAFIQSEHHTKDSRK